MTERLSRNFTVDEMLVSATAARMGRTVELAQHARPNLVRLCEEILEPLRASLRKPIVVVSGYRPPWLNRAVGGSPRSQHMAGEAADIIVPGFSPREVCERIVKLELPFHQLILEFPPQGWAHVSVAPAGKAPAGDIRTARKVNGLTRYDRGLA
jgi:zinc D-Ala-D-Ala carboxypeptidase